MPKDIIDYSNTIIYKIYCNDSNVTDIYIGHTTNFIKRKYQHKILCNSSKKLKIYDLIRSNGGWDNWNMIEIAKYNCQDATEARIREQEHYDLLKPTLNTFKPISDNEYSILSIDNDIKNKEDLKYKCEKKNDYYCEKCNYRCYKKYSWLRHLDTSKHHKETDGNNLGAITGNNGQISHVSFLCENCDKLFQNRSGLWKHKKKCCANISDNTEKNTPKTNFDDIELSDKQIIAMLIKENSEFKSMMMEIVKNGTHNTTTNNSHNKTFNLNFFLNEQCKDALNMSDFLHSICVDISDLEHTGRAGFVEGISKLLLKNLRALDQSKRPIHCSDLKRETLYIKDNNKWEKDDDEKLKLKKVIKEIAHENIKKISDWTKLYPECRDPESRKNDVFLKIVSNSMSGGSAEETEKNLNNIVRNIAREVVIEK